MAVPMSGFGLIDVCNEIYGTISHDGKSLASCFADAKGTFHESVGNNRNSLLDFAGYENSKLTLIADRTTYIKSGVGNILIGLQANKRYKLVLNAIPDSGSEMNGIDIRYGPKYVSTVWDDKITRYLNTETDTELVAYGANARLEWKVYLVE